MASFRRNAAAPRQYAAYAFSGQMGVRICRDGGNSGYDLSPIARRAFGAGRPAAATRGCCFGKPAAVGAPGPYHHPHPADHAHDRRAGIPRQPGVPPEFVRAPAARPPAGISSELRVVEALHKLGADLGDPLEISREGRQVLVSGTGIPSKRQEELHAVLDPLPDVVVRFADSAFPASAPPVQSEPAPARDAAGPEHTELPARIEECLGGGPQFERFSGQLLDWTDS